MAGISVRLVEMDYSSYVTVAGTQISLDFSSDVGEGESVLAYTVGLSFFQVRYATDSSESSEDIGQMGVSLVPNQVGNTVYVTVNQILTDFDGSGASENQDVSGRNSYVWITGIAYIGTSLSNQTAIVCTAYDLPSTGTSSPGIAINSSVGVDNNYFLSGFDVYFSPKGGSAEPDGFSVSASANISSSIATLNGKVALDTSGQSSTGSVDVGFMSTFGVNNYAVKEWSNTWGKASNSNFQTASLSESFTIPEGYTKISNAGLLLQKVDLSVGNDHHIQEIGFGVVDNGLTISGDTVTGTLGVSMWGDRDGNYYLNSGDLTAYLIVQFA
ncbi:MAG: hypothetical protein ACJ74G_15365 [Blastocatellia bacterium]